MRTRRRPLVVASPPATVACITPIPMLPPRPRRGRAPAYIPDPWSDLEWEEHVAAQQAVASHPHGMTLEEIGRVMNITRERVRQIEHSALKKLGTDTGGSIAWMGKLTLSIPDCKKCGEPYARVKGRQTFCPACEATKRRKRPSQAAAAWFAANMPGGFPSQSLSLS